MRAGAVRRHQWPAVASAQSATDETAIRSIIAEQAAAWTAGDAAGYTSRVGADVSFTNLFGMVMYGKPAFDARHKEILATFFKGTTKKHAIRKVRFITADVAIVDIDNEVHGVKAMPPGVVIPPGGVLRSQLMQVFARRSGQWWVEAYHNVDTKPAAPR